MRKRNPHPTKESLAADKKKPPTIPGMATTPCWVCSQSGYVPIEDTSFEAPCETYSGDGHISYNPE